MIVINRIALKYYIFKDFLISFKTVWYDRITVIVLILIDKPSNLILLYKMSTALFLDVCFYFETEWSQSSCWSQESQKNTEKG